MQPIRFGLRAWQAWAPGTASEGTSTPPPILRRRVTPVGQQALSAVWRLPDAAQARYILSSRHGEFARTLSLLQAVAEKSELSPADFTLSVHHALVGLLSIAQNNPRGHTAIASGQESFFMGLIEAAACLQENPKEPVIFIHFDDLLPGAYADFNEPGEQPIALALALGAAEEGASIQLDMTSVANAAPSPITHAQNFLHFLESNAASGTSTGEGRQWRWARV